MSFKRAVYTTFFVLAATLGESSAGEFVGHIPELNSIEVETVQTSELYGKDQEYLVEGYVGATTSSLRVRVTTSARLVFESYCCTEQPDGSSISWRYRVGEEWTAKSATRPIEFEVGLPNLIAAAKDIVRINAAPPSRRWDVEPLDDWGCDIPDWLGGRAIECSNKGNCCDTHDACYATFGCGAWSWTTGAATPACLACNAFVVACITFDTGSTWLPSECCYLGNCGQSRGGSGAGGGGGIRNLDPAYDPSGGGGGGGWSEIPSGGFRYSGTCCVYDPAIQDYVCLSCG